MSGSTGLGSRTPGAGDPPAVGSWDVARYAALLPWPAADANKATRGRVLIVGGAPGLTGAACLAAEAALRSGAGHVTVAVPGVSLAVVEAKLTAPVKMPLAAAADGDLLPAAVGEVLAAAERADAVVLGPGLGRGAGARMAVLEIVARLGIPLVIDADALFALGGDLAPVAARTAPTVLTPHAGEAARLLGTTAERIAADRPAAALALACGASTAVLKGPGTLVAHAGRILLNPTGGPELATLGTGDVLAGLIGGLLACGMLPMDAAALGTYLHGAAGRASAAELTPICTTAEDVIGHLAGAVRELAAADAMRRKDLER